MSATSYAYRGLEAVEKKDWAAAVPLLDKALEETSSPLWLLARSQAHLSLKNYEDALRDAELAYHVAAERGSGTSRKQMIDAQYRRAVIYHKLKQYADSDCCAKWSMLLAEGRPAREDDGIGKKVDADGNYTVTYEEAVKDNENLPDYSMKDSLRDPAAPTKAKTGFESQWTRAYVWRTQVLGALKRLPENDPGRKVHVVKIPPRPKVERKPEPQVVELDSEDEKPVAKPSEPVPGSVPDEQLKLRVDFYQTNQNVTVTLFVKGIKKEDLNVKFSKNKVQISPIARAAAPYVKPGDREASSTLHLNADIIPAGSRWTVTPQKIELVLQKATPGKWGSWGKEEIGITESISEEDATESPAVAAPAQASAPAVKPAAAPAYPTSSRTGPKNWDKLEELEGAEEEQSDVNGFFKRLFKDASPEAQRAMMKSFTESNGTALSTDWNDVKDRKVETVPPEGVEAKKWDS
ncbi:SGS domain-containing protein [Triangularia verruculosa]|uniref:SGS domain-containing protein n=1 Tax=Triangularia verruculosa TaxID=2587418 RepID=A0AAN7AWZ8_9PEZI|nr:SGS domain-containing protein [Triangularia verruculosa]